MHFVYSWMCFTKLLLSCHVHNKLFQPTCMNYESLHSKHRQHCSPTMLVGAMGALLWHPLNKSHVQNFQPTAWNQSSETQFQYISTGWSGSAGVWRAVACNILTQCKYSVSQASMHLFIFLWLFWWIKHAHKGVEKTTHTLSYVYIWDESNGSL